MTQTNQQEKLINQKNRRRKRTNLWQTSKDWKWTWKNFTSYSWKIREGGCKRLVHVLIPCSNGYTVCNHQSWARVFSRQNVIRNICQAFPLFASIRTETDAVCTNSSKMPKSDHFLQRQSSWHFNIIAASFLASRGTHISIYLPPVTECLQCEETLYFFARVSVTLYTVSVPIPG